MRGQKNIKKNIFLSFNQQLRARWFTGFSKFSHILVTYLLQLLPRSFY